MPQNLPLPIRLGTAPSFSQQFDRFAGSDRETAPCRTMILVPTAAFTTLGCKVNQYETQRILESFEAAGFEVVPFDSPADVYVINSCSVTGIAESKSRYMIRKAGRTNPGARIVVTGCAAQMAINQAGNLEGVDLMVPNPDKLETLDHVFATFPELCERVRREPSRKPAHRPKDRTRATIKVQDGCDVHCSYCSIPYTRPGLRSRAYDEVLEEAQGLATQGYKEAVLTGVLIGAYGPPTFEELVAGLARHSGIERLRISSIEMHQVTEPIIGLVLDGHVTPHFHIPLQSGSDKVLADMNRRYRSADFLALCSRLKSTIPDLSLTTDVLVGFPTETEQDFTDTLRVCEDVGFLKVHTFRFSPRPGTPADQWGDPVQDAVKQERAKRLVALSDSLGSVHIRRFVSRSLRVLVEAKKGKDGLLAGHSDNYIEVRFAGPLSLANTFQWVRIEDEREGVAYGEIVSKQVATLRVL